MFPDNYYLTNPEEDESAPILVPVGRHGDDAGVADVVQIHREHVLEQLGIVLLELVVVHHLVTFIASK